MKFTIGCRNVLMFLILLFLISGCAPKKEVLTKEDGVKEEDGTMKIESPDFKDGKTIPSEFTCDGKNISPELVFKDVPEKAKSLALIVDDPDAPRGTFTHWVVCNIHSDVKGFSKGEKITYIQGKADTGKTVYGGPCPPSGAHRYFFKLYALDITLGLKEGFSRADLEKAVKGHVISESKLMGTYQRA